MNHRTTPPIALAAASALALALLAGCPADEKKDTGAASPTPALVATATALPSPTGTAAATASATVEATPGATHATRAPAADAATASAGGAAGKTVYVNRCQVCHGQDGSGGMGVALVGVKKKGDALIRKAVVEGRPDLGMPAFEGQLTPAEVDAVVAHVKRL